MRPVDVSDELLLAGSDPAAFEELFVAGGGVAHALPLFGAAADL